MIADGRNKLHIYIYVCYVRIITYRCLKHVCFLCERLAIFILFSKDATGQLYQAAPWRHFYQDNFIATSGDLVRESLPPKFPLLFRFRNYMKQIVVICPDVWYIYPQKNS